MISWSSWRRGGGEVVVSVMLRLKEKSDCQVDVIQVGVARKPHRFQGRSRGK